MTHRWLLVCLALVFGAGCKRNDCVELADAPSAKPVDQALVAYLSLASALHHEADLAESANTPQIARDALDRLLATKIPGNYTEVREVRADTLARSAELAMRAGELGLARQRIEAGLRELTEDNYYRGRLYEVSGLLYLEESKKLEAIGDLAAAEAKKKSAVEDLERTVRIQQGVIERATRDGGAP